MFKFDGYTFYQNKDSFGGDVHYYPDKTITELKEICDSNIEYIGFNTYGYIKSKITTRDNFTHLKNNNKKILDGLYVNNKKYYEQFSHIEFTDYEYVSNMDFFGCDYVHEQNKNIYELKELCDSNFNLVCFNTLGYVKYDIDKNKLVKLSKSTRQGQGLYIKKNIPYTQVNITNNLDYTIYNNTRAFCINLLRRPDRKTKMMDMFKKLDLPVDFYEAVDGKKLELTNEIKRLFNNNIYNWKKAPIGCALSHLNLLKQLSEDNNYDKYLIFEDDIEISPLFNQRIKYVINEMNKNSNWDIVLIGHSISNHDNIYMELAKKNNNIPLRYIEMNIDRTCGGAFGYIITKNYAIKVIEYLKSNSMRYPIDYFYFYQFKTNIIEFTPQLVYTNYVDFTDPNNTTDSDIQRSYDRFDM